MNCPDCDIQLNSLPLLDTLECSKCGLELVYDTSSAGWLTVRNKRYYHDGDGVIREVKEGEEKCQ